MKTIKKHWRKVVLAMGAILILCMLLGIWGLGVFLRSSFEAVAPPPTPCPTFECTPDPSSHRIAFSSDRRFGHGQEIFLMNADGTCVTQLTDSSGFFVALSKAVRPAWSPDGTQILFELHSQHEPPETDLYVVSADGGQVKRLTRDGESCDARWSPDGSKIAFKSDDKLHIMDSDSSNQRQLTDISTLKCMSSLVSGGWSYSWSPDGKQIAFTGLHPGTTQREVYVINMDGSRLTNLTDHPRDDELVMWWAEEDKILFQSNRTAVDEIVRQFGRAGYVMDVDGTNVRRIIGPESLSSQQDYERYFVRGWARTPTLQLILSNVDDGEVVLLDVACALENWSEPGTSSEECYSSFSEPRYFGMSGGIHGVYWSSGNPQLALKFQDHERITNEIVVINYDGTGATNLTACSADDIDPAWSP